MNVSKNLRHIRGYEFKNSFQKDINRSTSEIYKNINSGMK